MSVLVVVRWVLLGALLIAVDYQPVEDTRGFALVGSLIVIALALNLVLQWRLVSHREI